MSFMRSMTDTAVFRTVSTPVYGAGEVEEFAIISYDPERFEALDAGGFWLSETPDEYSASWGNEVIRSASWAMFRSLESGLSFLHVNTHLDHVSERARVGGEPAHSPPDGGDSS